METVGDRIKALREARGMSTSEVAHRLGILAPNYRKYENGERNPKREQVEKLAQLFGCLPTDILENETDRLERNLNSIMVNFIVSSFVEYENLCDLWGRYSLSGDIEYFFLNRGEQLKEDAGDTWPGFENKTSQLKELFSLSDVAARQDRAEQVETRFWFMAYFVDYFYHRRDRDTILNEIKEVLGPISDTEARIRFAGRVLLPAFSVFRDMASYLADQQELDFEKAFSIACNF